MQQWLLDLRAVLNNIDQCPFDQIVQKATTLASMRRLEQLDGVRCTHWDHHIRETTRWLENSYALLTIKWLQITHSKRQYSCSWQERVLDSCGEREQISVY